MVIISVQAYCKMILHAAKYPHNTVNGILLATARKDTPSDRKEFVVCDAVPLFHISIHLTPMSEVALLQIEQDCHEKGLMIVGYYTANENVGEINLDKFNSRIASKISENVNPAILVLVNNANLRIDLDNIAIKVAQFNNGKWQMFNIFDIVLEHNSTLDICSGLLQKQVYKRLIDFDNKLDRVSNDWTNSHVRNEINDFLKSF